MPREGKALPRNTQQIGGRAKTRTQVMSPEAERREGGREECGEEKKKAERRRRKRQTVRGEKSLEAGEGLEVNLLKMVGWHH